MSHVIEISRGERFEFGKNWKSFLTNLDETRIAEAERSLREMLQLDDLLGKSFLDVGSGSGIFSLAARRLGARVHSFDYDPESVACTAELKRRYFFGDPKWTTEEGSVLNRDYLASLGTFDVVYSWGVLHHTGKMWQALDNVAHSVAPLGRLFIAIYNDVGWRSRSWRWIKKTYNVLPASLKTPFVLFVFVPGQTKALLESTVRWRLGEYISSWLHYSQNRGMSRWHDAVDWIGGYPYEFAKPDELIGFYVTRGFKVTRLKHCDYRLGCNEFVFVRDRELTNGR
jgi:2-polyprenyl-6-hydroxyphenyl methylase/3-demethylubiquinone-9 3-methyltransferase